MLPDNFYRKLLDNMFEGVYFVDTKRKITFWSKGAQRLTGFAPEEVIDSSCSQKLIRHVDWWGHNLCQKDHCPACNTMKDGQIREMKVAYHHKDGYLVPALSRFLPYKNDNGEIAGAIEIFQDITPVEREKEKIEGLMKLAMVDPLTQIANRRGTQMRISSKLNEFHRYGWPFALLFCDVDDFKFVNDNYGHSAGDQVLKAVSGTLAKNLRTSDFVGRWGGDEFLAVLSNVDRETVRLVAEKVRRMVAQSTVRVGEGPKDDSFVSVTTSMGAVLAEPEDTMETLLARADTLMYESKNSGKDRVSFG